MLFDAHLSTLFTEVPMLRRPEAARAAGFEAVECWWPFDTAVPGDAEVEQFVAAVSGAGVRLVALNFFGGDLASGQRGLVSWPGRQRELADSVDVALDIGRRLGCRAFNALYGNRLDGVRPAEQDDLAVATLTRLATAAGRIGARVVVEPLSGIPAYPLRTAADVVSVLDRVRRPELALLADLYHLAVNGADLDEVLTRHRDRIGHVQIADAPGRHEPGTGGLALRTHLATLADGGYEGHVGCEYVPSTDTHSSLTGLRALTLAPRREGQPPRRARRR